ncbi:MAG: hypothetical protein NZ957_02460 [Thaumarchaeota archaeon]|nr:hypothetical protein [Candidatus Calditenuaceae archaeon]
MIKWKIENGVLSIMFENENDIAQFIDQVLKGPAQQFGLVIEVKKRGTAQQQNPPSRSLTVRI